MSILPAYELTGSLFVDPQQYGLYHLQTFNPATQEWIWVNLWDDAFLRTHAAPMKSSCVMATEVITKPKPASTSKLSELKKTTAPKSTKKELGGIYRAFASPSNAYTITYMQDGKRKTASVTKALLKKLPRDKQTLAIYSLARSVGLSDELVTRYLERLDLI